MRICFEGREVRCDSFAALKPGDVFTCCRLPYAKTSSNTMVRLQDGAVETYIWQTIFACPDAILYLNERLPPPGTAKEHA